MEVTDVQYKESEIGVIPVDWEVKTLGDVGEVKMCRRVFNQETKSEGVIPFYKIGTFGKEADAYISQELYDNYRQRFSFPKTGDVLISAAGTIGRTMVYDGEPAYYQDSNIVWIDNKEGLVLNKYLYYVLQVAKYNTEGGTIQRLYNSILKNTKFICPTKSEQTAIATALSDTDALIENLEKLIAKKRSIKQGMMQELLTGSIRLDGFEKKWLNVSLGEISEITMGQSPQSKYYNTKGLGLPLVQGNADIEDRKTIIRIHTTEITKIGEPGTTIMSVRAPVGEVAKTNFRCCLGRGVCAIKYKNDFLYHLLIYLEDSWGKYSTGSTFDSINSSQVKNLEIYIPSDFSEQVAIASIFNDIDEEIETLEQKLYKYKMIKEGMMQSLLTGKIRLV